MAVTAIAEVSEQARRARWRRSGAVLYPGRRAEMLDGAAVDGVLITAPSDQHAQIVAEVAARGLPVLCEKPCGVTAAQTRAAVAGRGGGGGAVPGRVLAALRARRCGRCGTGSPPVSWAPSTW